MSRGMGRIWKRGNVWWMEVWHQGKPFPKSTGTADENEARAMLGEWYAEVKRGLYVPEARNVVFADLERLALDSYEAEERRSTRTLKNNLAHLRESFGGMRALDITTPRLAAYVAHRRRQGASPSTVHKEMAAMSLMLRLARTNYGEAFRHRPEFPRVVIPKSSIRQGFFEPDVLQAVLAHLPLHYRHIVVYLALTGCRRGEALALEWRNVDERAGVIRIEDTKNDEPRTIPYAGDPALVDLLRVRRETARAIAQRTRRVVRYVFTNPEGHPLLHGFSDAWEKAREAAGHPGKRIHDLRRTVVREMERAGVPRSAAMKLAGHKTESIYKRYAIVNEADLVDARKRLVESRARNASVNAVRELYGNSGD